MQRQGVDVALGVLGWGCIVPQNPSFVSDVFHSSYTYVTKQSGKKHPTFVIIGQDNESGKNGARIFAIAATGAGFKVERGANQAPHDAAGRLQPVRHGGDDRQQRLATRRAVLRGERFECLSMYSFMKTAGYKGVFGHGIWTNALVKPFAGSVINNPTVNPLENNPGMNQLKADLDAVKPGSSADVDYGAIVGYTSADMFIQALKIAAKKGKSNITPENVRNAASTMTWKLDGVQGPIAYPRSTVDQSPACFSNYYSDGAKWTTAVPYTCSTKTYSPNLKVG